MTWNASNIPYVPPRLTSLGFDYECSLSTLSPPPSPVTNLELESYNIRQFNITLMLRWSPPSFPNGILAAYNVCAGNTPLRPIQEPELGNDLASMRYCGTIDKDSSGTVKLLYLDRRDSEDLYIQVNLKILLYLFIKNCLHDTRCVHTIYLFREIGVTLLFSREVSLFLH